MMKVVIKKASKEKKNTLNDFEIKNSKKNKFN